MDENLWMEDGVKWVMDRQDHPLTSPHFLFPPATNSVLTVTLDQFTNKKVSGVDHGKQKEKA